MERRKGSLRLERQSFITHWKELSEFVQPRRGRFLVTDRNDGKQKHKAIINSQATWAHRVARAGLLAGSMSPARPWFAFDILGDPELREFLPVKIWLNQVERLIRTIFNQSNFYSQSSAMLGELLLFGTGAMSHVDDFENVARFFTHTVGSYMIGQDDKYRARTLCREYQHTVEQVVAQFGIDRVSPTVRNMYDRGDYDKWVDLVQLVEPNPDQRRGRLDSRFLPYRSTYYEPGHNDKDAVLSDKGFHEFPVYIPRWERTGEDIYGTDCPGMTALGDTKGLQTQEKRKAQGIDKSMNPPLKGPPSLDGRAVSALPGGMNTYVKDPSGESLSALYEVNPRIGELVQDMDRVESRIGRAFLVDIFLAITNMEGIQPRNQLDLLHRNQERLLQVGPVLQNIHGEFLALSLDRTFNQSVRADILPPAPPELQGRALEPKFISTLAMAQEASATESIDRMTDYVTRAASVKPEVIDKWDADQSVDEYGQALGVPPRIIIPDEIVQQRRQARAQQAEQERSLAAAQSVATTAKTAADAKTGDDQNLLTEALAS